MRQFLQSRPVSTLDLNVQGVAASWIPGHESKHVGYPRGIACHLPFVSLKAGRTGSRVTLKQRVVRLHIFSNAFDGKCAQICSSADIGQRIEIICCSERSAHNLLTCASVEE